MSSYRCPNGHTSTDADYCDVCGEPIRSVAAASLVGGSSVAAGSASVAGTAADPGPPAGGPSVATRECPGCGSVNAVDALFCEDCGWDFTTGQAAIPPPPPSPLDLGAPLAGANAGDGTGAPATAAAPSDAGPADATDQAVPIAPVTLGDPQHGGAVPPPMPGSTSWVAEVWVDPQWYAAQDATDPCPSAGLPTVIPLRQSSILIGRPSVSRNIHPQVDLTPDTGVSRRHAQLTTDGQRWWVEDLQSANGTYLGSANAELPTDPIKAGQRAELDEDARLYLGAWSRVVLRPATAEETAAGLA